MRTFLRSIRSGEYVETFETWTATPDHALDFESIPRALELVRRRGLKDMELVILEAPDHTVTVPVEKLRLSPSFREVEQIESETRGKKPREHVLKAVAPASARQPRSQRLRKAGKGAGGTRKHRPAGRKPKARSAAKGANNGKGLPRRRKRSSRAAKPS